MQWLLFLVSKVAVSEGGNAAGGGCGHPASEPHNLPGHPLYGSLPGRIPPPLMNWLSPHSTDAQTLVLGPSSAIQGGRGRAVPAPPGGLSAGFRALVLGSGGVVQGGTGAGRPPLPYIRSAGFRT